jgi:hypothetical protein
MFGLKFLAVVLGAVALVAVLSDTIGQDVFLAVVACLS